MKKKDNIFLAKFYLACELMLDREQLELIVEVANDRQALMRLTKEQRGLKVGKYAEE